MRVARTKASFTIILSSKGKGIICKSMNQRVIERQNKKNKTYSPSSNPLLHHLLRRRVPIPSIRISTITNLYPFSI